MLEAVRWDLASDLEESSYHWRNARLADLGFPELGEALAYYAYTDPNAPLPQLEKAPPVTPGLFLERLQPADRFFDRSLKLVPADEVEIVERQMVTLLNAVMVAEKVDPGEIEQVQRAIDGARDTLSLGLEHASGGDPARGATLLVGAPLKRVFQIGFSLGLKLKHRADRLMKSGRASLASIKDIPLFDSPIGESIAAVRRRRPLYSEALDNPEAPNPAMRPFRDRAELARASAAIDEGEHLSEIAASVGFDSAKASEALSAGRPPETLVFLHLSDLYLTAVARGMVGEGFAFAPLPKSRLDDFAHAAFEVHEEKPALTPALVAALHQPIERAAVALSEAHRKSADDFLKLCEKRLLEDIGGPFAASGSVDPEMPLPLVVAS
jgi:hypothetical protein